MKHVKTSKKDLCFQLIEDSIVLYRWKLIIPASLQHEQSVGITITFSTLATHISKRQWDPWYTGKVCIIPSNHKSNLADLAKNKRHSQKYGHVLSKLVIMTPQRALCVALIRQYTLKGIDNTRINFMCLTMIDPATSWSDIKTTNCHNNWLSPIRARVKRQHTYSLETIFYL
jgi:hypothetical protein